MPLPNNEWTKGKCGMKGILYMSVGIPAVMSNVGMNKDIIEHGENGFLPVGEKQWVEILSKLIENKELRINFENIEKKNDQNFQAIIGKFTIQNLKGDVEILRRFPPANNTGGVPAISNRGNDFNRIDAWYLRLKTLNIAYNSPISTSVLVSSKVSLKAPCETVSPFSRNPPGSVHLPYLGSIALLHKRTEFSFTGIVPTIILGFV